MPNIAGSSVGGTNTPNVPTSEAEKLKKQPSQFEPLEVYLQAHSTQIDKENKPEELARNCRIVRNEHYYEGNQAGYASAINGLWQPIPDPEGFHKNNYVRPIVKRVAKEWARSTTRMRVKPWSDSPEEAGAARQADKIIQFYQEHLMPPSLRQREGKYAQLAGEYFRYVRWDDSAGPIIPKAKYGKKTVTIGQDSHACMDCGRVGTPAEFGPGCPECASMSTNVTPAPAVEIDIEVGKDYQASGDMVLELVDPKEVKADLHARAFFETPYVRRKRLVRDQILKAKFPWADFTPGGDSQELQWQKRVEVSPGNTGSGFGAGIYGSSAYSDHMVEFEQVWLDRAMYADYQLPEDCPIGDPDKGGQVIPAGTMLIDLCPHGLYVARANGKLIDIRDEDFRDHWSHGVNDLIPGRLHGDGIEDIIELQDLINDVHSLYFAHLMYCSSPALLFDSNKIKSAEMPNRPGMQSPVEGMMPGERLSDAVYQIPAEPITAQVDNFLDRMSRDMFEHGGADSMNAGDPGVDNKTATGASIIHGAAQALIGLQLELRSETDVTTFTQILKLAQQHWQDNRYLPLLGNHSQLEGEWFKASDVPKDFIMVAVSGSWMPRSEDELRGDLAAAIQVCGIPLGPWNPQCPPALRALVLDRFNLPTDTEPSFIDSRVAKLKLDRLRMAYEVATETGLPTDIQTDPNTGQPLAPVSPAIQFALGQVPVDVLVDNADIHIAVITDFLKTDDGLNADTTLINLLHTRIQQLFSAKTQLMAMQMQQQGALAQLQAQMQGQIQSQNPQMQSPPQPGGPQSKPAAPPQAAQQAAPPRPPVAR